MTGLTIKSRKSSGWINLHHRLFVLVDGGNEDESNHSKSAQDRPMDEELAICSKRQQKYDIPSALAAFCAGTHEIDVHLGRYGIPYIFAMPSGAMWVSVVRSGAVFRHFKHSHALASTSHVKGKYQVLVQVSEHVRAGIMDKVAAAFWFKHKRTPWKDHQGYPDPGPLPEVPKEVKPLELAITGRVFSFYRQSYLLLTVGSHRILFLERPGVALTNKWIEWEARLLHDNYPKDSIGARSTTAVAGVHYTLLISHEDRNRLRWFPWVGANDDGCGTATVDLESILGLVANSELPENDPCVEGEAKQSVSTAQPTAQELALIVLAFHPLMCSAISHRKWTIYLFPLKLLMFVWFCNKVVKNLIFLSDLVSGTPIV